MDTSTSAALSGCVSSLRSSMHLLDSSIAILDDGVRDYPRLTRVLQATRHFELVSEPDLLAAQASLKSEIQPEISNLLARAEAYLDKLGRREKSLIAKAELQQGRLSQAPPTAGGGASFAGSTDESANAGAELSRQEAMRMQQLRQKKERLSYAVGRLELQASQRQRQLRKSMAAQ